MITHELSFDSKELVGRNDKDGRPACISFGSYAGQISAYDISEVEEGFTYGDGGEVVKHPTAIG